PRTANTFQQCVGQWIPGFLYRRHASLMGFPYEGRTKRIEDLHDCRTDLRSDAVAGDKGCWDWFLFMRLHISLLAPCESGIACDIRIRHAASASRGIGRLPMTIPRARASNEP